MLLLMRHLPDVSVVAPFSAVVSLSARSFARLRSRCRFRLLADVSFALPSVLESELEK